MKTGDVVRARTIPPHGDRSKVVTGQLAMRKLEEPRKHTQYVVHGDDGVHVIDRATIRTVKKSQPGPSDVTTPQPLGERKDEKKRKKPKKRRSVQHNGGNRLSKDFKHRDLIE